MINPVNTTRTGKDINRTEFNSKERYKVLNEFFECDYLDLVEKKLGKKYSIIYKENKLYKEAEEYFEKTNKYRLDKRDPVAFSKAIIKGEMIERYCITYFKSVYNKELVFNKTESQKGKDLIIVEGKNFISNETDLKVKGTNIGIEVTSEESKDCKEKGVLFLRNNKLLNLIKRSKTKETYIVLFILETREMGIIKITPDMEKNLENNKTTKYNKEGYNLNISEVNFLEMKNIKEQVDNNFPINKETKECVFIYNFVHTVLDRFTGKPIQENVRKFIYL